MRNTPTATDSCIQCNSTNIKEDAVLATLGESELNGNYVKSILCLDCETLMIVTPEPKGVVAVHHSVGNQVTVRD